MLKKLTAMALVLLLALSAAACGPNQGGTSNAPGAQATDPAGAGGTATAEPSGTTDAKVMVNYGVDAELTTMDIHVVTDGNRIPSSRIRWKD